MEHSEMVRNYLQVLDLHNRSLDLEFLNDLIAGHVATFAFSSVGCQLGDDLPLDFESLYQRIVLQRRGGYCFEQNGLLYKVLEDLGFSPQLFLGRVIYNKDIHPGLTHRITIVESEGQQYVLDVGFGFLGPRRPIPMSGVECCDNGKIFRIKESRPDEFHLQVLKDNAFFSLYRFELARYGQADCELGHFFSHKHPKANFVNHLVVSCIQENVTLSLVDLKYRVITNSNTTHQDIDSTSQLLRVLTDELGVQVTADEARTLYKKLNAKT